MDMAISAGFCATSCIYFRWGGAVSGEGASICLANNGVAVGDTWGLGRKCSASAEIQSEGGGQEPLRESGVGYDLHRATIFHECETVALVERSVFAFLGHHLEEHIAGIAFLDAFDKTAADMHALVFRIHQHPVHVREHFAVVEHAREARELIAVPCADDGVAAEQCAVDAVGILGGLPTDRREQFMDLILREALLVRSIAISAGYIPASISGDVGGGGGLRCVVRHRTTERWGLASRDGAKCGIAQRNGQYWRRATSRYARTRDAHNTEVDDEQRQRSEYE